MYCSLVSCSLENCPLENCSLTKCCTLDLSPNVNKHPFLHVFPSSSTLNSFPQPLRSVSLSLRARRPTGHLWESLLVGVEEPFSGSPAGNSDEEKLIQNVRDINKGKLWRRPASLEYPGGDHSLLTPTPAGYSKPLYTLSEVL